MVVETLNALVRPVIALALTGALIYLAIVGAIPVNDFMNVVLIVLGFFFGSREANKAITDAVARVQQTRNPTLRTRTGDNSDASRD